MAPVVEYLENARDYGGLLILDDTQALGVLGHSPDADAPYGKGGGGALRWSGVAGPDLLVGSSLAKGFGVPLAALSGGNAAIRYFEAKSETRQHCSPPSAAVIHAAEHALAVNGERGDALRSRLAKLVQHFRLRLAQIGLSAAGGIFPFQTLALGPDLETTALHERLLRLGVRTVLHRNRAESRDRISLLITARHSRDEIDRAADAIGRALTARR